MARPKARFTEADLKRALRAASATGDDFSVRVLPDGTIEIFRGYKTLESVQPLAPKRIWVT